MMSRSGLVLDAEELEALHECLLANDVVVVDHDMRLLVEERWPELTDRLMPPKERLHYVVQNLSTSCPALCRASTSWPQRKVVK